MHDLVTQLIPLLHQYGYVIVFLGTIIAGDAVILAACFLAFLGFFNIFIVIGLSFTGTVLSDSAWYYIGFRGKAFIARAVDFLCLPKLCMPKSKPGFFRNNFNNHYGPFLISSKFLYGTRTAIILASGHQKVGFKKFFKYNIIGTVIWLVLLVGIAYLVGFSWDYLDRYSDLARYWALAILILIVVVRWLVKKIFKLYNHEPRS